MCHCIRKTILDGDDLSSLDIFFAAGFRYAGLGFVPTEIQLQAIVLEAEAFHYQLIINIIPACYLYPLVQSSRAKFVITKIDVNYIIIGNVYFSPNTDISVFNIHFDIINILLLKFPYVKNIIMVGDYNLLYNFTGFPA